MRSSSRIRLALVVLALVTAWAALPLAEAQLICPHYFCRSNQDCRTRCPTTAGAGCVNNVCQYDWDSSNGNWGFCPTPFCTSNDDCEEACPAAPSAQCVNNGCQYSG